MSDIEIAEVDDADQCDHQAWPQYVTFTVDDRN